MANTIVLFHGKLKTLNVFSEQMQKEFQQLGYDIFMFDQEQSMQSLGKLYAYMQEHPILAMIGFNNTLFGMKTESGKKVWEELGIPCINILVDHPYWYRDILQNAPANSAVLCVDMNHMNFVSRFYPQIAVSGFLAHGGTPIDGKGKKLEERAIDVLYAGSLLTNYVQKPDFSKWDFDAEQVCEEAISLLMNNRTVTVEDALEHTLLQHGVELEDSLLCEFISSCSYVERVVSSHFREMVLKTFAMAGIKLQIYGEGWENCDWITLPNVSYGGLISPEEVLQKMEDAKVVLNTMPWFKNGSHERIFNGMLRGCVVISETSGYFEETLPENGWLSFSLEEEEIEKTPGRVKDLLDHLEEAQKMADAGLSFAEQDHTWQARAREIHEDLLKYL